MAGIALEHSTGGPPQKRVSLRAKATLTFVAVAAYALAVFVYVEFERRAVIANVAGLDQMHVTEEALTRAALSASDAMFLVNRSVARSAEVSAGMVQELAFAMEELRRALSPLLTERPELGSRLAGLESAVRAFRTDSPLANLFELRVALSGLAREVDREATLARERRRGANDAFRRGYERIALVSLGLGLVGLVAFGLANRVFFTRLASQIDSVRDRAAAIVQGYRGAPLAIHRRDEVGQLARAVNQMAADLAERERRIDFGARQQMHRERMAAFGAMAANVAHEIGNPVAAIAGLAQEMLAHRATAQCAQCRPELLLEQTDRIARMTRHLSELAASRAGDSGPMDLNATAGAVCDVVRFDPRLQLAEVVLEPGAALPAALAVPDHVMHIVMNLVLAAVEPLPAGVRAGRIRVSTGAEGARLLVRVAPAIPSDDEDARSRAFDDPARISVSRYLAEQMGGSLKIQHDPEASAVLWLPAANESMEA